MLGPELAMRTVASYIGIIVYYVYASAQSIIQSLKVDVNMEIRGN